MVDLLLQCWLRIVVHSDCIDELSLTLEVVSHLKVKVVKNVRFVIEAMANHFSNWFINCSASFNDIVDVVKFFFECNFEILDVVWCLLLT